MKCNFSLSFSSPSHLTSLLTNLNPILPKINLWSCEIKWLSQVTKIKVWRTWHLLTSEYLLFISALMNLHHPLIIWALMVAQLVKNPLALQETCVAGDPGPNINYSWDLRWQISFRSPPSFRDRRHWTLNVHHDWGFVRLSQYPQQWSIDYHLQSCILQWISSW